MVQLKYDGQNEHDDGLDFLFEEYFSDLNLLKTCDIKVCTRYEVKSL